MISTKNLKQVLLVFLVCHTFLVSGAAIKDLEDQDEKHENTPVIEGDGPWKAKVDKQINELADKKDEAIHEVEHHTQQKLDDVEHKNQAEQEHVVEHEQAVKKDIENRHVVEKNIALKQELEHKLLELEKQKHDLEKNTDHELHDLEKQKHELELKKYELELLAKHKSNDLEKQKFELSLKKHDIEMNIHNNAKDIEHQKKDDHKRIEKHEHAVNEHVNHDLHDLKQHRHDLDTKHHDDLDHHKHILEQDHAFKQHWGQHYPHRHWERPHFDHHEHDVHYHKPDLHKKLPEVDLEHHHEHKVLEEKHDLIDKALITPITLDSKATHDGDLEEKIVHKRHVPFHEPPFEHHHYHPYPHHGPPGPPPHHHDFHHHEHEHFGPHGKPFGCGHDHSHDFEHGIPPFFDHGKPHGKPPGFEHRPPVFEHGKPPIFGHDKPHNVPEFPGFNHGHDIEHDKHDKPEKHDIDVEHNKTPVKGVTTVRPKSSNDNDINSYGSESAFGNDPLNTGSGLSTSGLPVSSSGRGQIGGNPSTRDSDVQGLITNIFSSQPAGGGASDQFGGSTFTDIDIDTQQSRDSISEPFLETDTTISKGVKPLRLRV